MRNIFQTWINEIDTQKWGFHLLLLLLSSGIATLVFALLPPIHYLESKLYDFRLYFQGASELHPDMLLVQLTHSESTQLFKTLNRLNLNEFKAIGLDTPHAFSGKEQKDLLKFKTKPGPPMVLALQMQIPQAEQSQRIYTDTLPQATDSFGFYPLDLDGTIRSHPVLLRYQTPDRQIHQLPSFSYALYQQIKPQAQLSVSHRYLAYPNAQSAYQTMTLKQFQSLKSPQRQGKILLISDHNTPLHGRTPFQSSVKPIELHAYALAGLLEHRSIVHPQILNSLLPLALSLVGLAILLLTLRWGFLVACVGLVTLVFSYFTFNLLLFHIFSVWLDLFNPLATMLVGTGSVLLYFHRTDGQTRRELYSTFRRHLPEQAVRALLDQQNEGLPNERRIVTVMFTDIQGFSRMGEKLPPDQIIQILNEYFSAMTEIIFTNQGSLDKYIGDGIMAVYGNIGSNNPRQDALYAMKTALEMLDRMVDLQKKWMNEGIRPIQIRIGINTGEALVGQVGHPRRKEMTVIGDTVNTAARIEKLNKQYHTHILISHSTYEYIKDWAEVRPLGEEQLAGKSSSVMVYELKGQKAQIGH